VAFEYEVMGLPGSASIQATTELPDDLAKICDIFFDDGHDVELWQLDRHVETFRHKAERPIVRHATADRAR
jgi:hypothetical protein